MCHVPAVDLKELAGAPEAEIAVTADMIDAGSRVLEKCYIGDGRYDLTFAIEEIYREMVSAMSPQPAPAHQILREGH